MAIDDKELRSDIIAVMAAVIRPKASLLENLISELFSLLCCSGTLLRTYAFL